MSLLVTNIMAKYVVTVELKIKSWRDNCKETFFILYCYARYQVSNKLFGLS